MASDFIQDIQFTDQPTGGITAKKLNIAWRDGQVSPNFVARQPVTGGVGAGDYLLVLQASGNYAKVPATAIGGGGGGTGTGDMLKSVYDTNNNGVVDTADSLAYSKLTGVPTSFTPSPHASTHLSGGSDPISLASATLAGLCPMVDNTTIQVVASKLTALAPAWTAITGKPSTFPPSAHASTHNLGGSDAIAPDWTQVQNKPANFTPSAHAPTHLDNGTDPIPVTTTTRTGSAPKLSGTATQFLNGAGGWTVPAGTATGDMTRAVYDTNADNIVDHAALSDTAPWTGITGKPATFPPSTHGSTHISTDPIPAATATTTGLVPTPPNNTTTFLRGDATFAAIPGGGDMLKGTYDTDNNGVVDTCDSLVWSRVIGAPLASTSLNGLLKQVSGNTTDFVDGTNNCQDLDTGVAKVISVRTRGLNILHNPNFEVDQRNIHNSITPAVGTTFICDRWLAQRQTPTGVATAQSVLGETTFSGGGLVSNAALRLQVSTSQATLAAGDYYLLTQNIEGSQMRSIFYGGCSISLYVRTNSSALKFGVSLRDSPATKSINYLCTVPSPGYSYITLPNIPAFPSGNFSMSPGVVGFALSIVLASGSTFTAPSNGTWNTGNYLGAVGQDSLFSLAAGNYLEVCMIQVEPGPICTPFIDKQFSQNLLDCQRYYQKTYNYAVKTGTASSSAGARGAYTTASQNIWSALTFSQTMAKVPSALNVFSDVTGTSGSVRDIGAGVDRGIGSVSCLGDAGFAGFTIPTPNPAATFYTFQWQADTGW